MNEGNSPRRRSLLKGAAVAAGAMSAPMIAIAQTITLRFQSTWPSKDISHEYATDFAKKVNDMASGKLKIDVLPAGAVVPAFQRLEAVNKGTLNRSHVVVAYQFHRHGHCRALDFKWPTTTTLAKARRPDPVSPWRSAGPPRGAHPLNASLIGRLG